jgi:hypothetical protein
MSSDQTRDDADLWHLRPSRRRANRRILRLINLIGFRISGASSVLIVFQPVEIPVDRAPDRQKLNDHSSGGKSVHVLQTIDLD